jgi:hypothetical protein
MPRLSKKKINKVTVEVFEAPLANIDIKIRKRFSGFSTWTRILALVLLFALNLNGIWAIKDTISYYSDVESSPSNVYAAGTLDFEVSSVSDFNPSPVCTNATSTRTINFLNLGNLPKYKANATSFVGVACDYLNLTAKLDGTTTYAGSLKNFISNEIIFAAPDVWKFDLVLASNAPAEARGQSCNFKFVFSGSQERNNLTFGAGFSDKEEITNTVNTCALPINKVLINKVFYDPEPISACGGPHTNCDPITHGTDPDNEWIELYNPSTSSIDVAGWQICDGVTCDTIMASTIIPAHGFAVITPSATTWNYWADFPVNAVKIVLNSPIGDGLDDNSDMLLLKNSNGVIVDQMNWGMVGGFSIPSLSCLFYGIDCDSATSSWPNWNSGVWDPGVADANSGYALARISTGYDTDQKTDWRALGLPKVTSLTFSKGTPWYCGATYQVNWATLNPNGSISDLKVDLYYIKDSNKNNQIDSSDTVYLEASNLTASSSYNFKIDSSKGYCFIGDVWVKLIVKGPENFMINNYKIGGPFYEPVDDEIFDPTAMCQDVAAYCAPNPETCSDIQQFCDDWQALEAEKAAEQIDIFSPVDIGLDDEQIFGAVSVGEIIEDVLGTSTIQEEATATVSTTTIEATTSTLTTEPTEEPVVIEEPPIIDNTPAVQEEPTAEPVTEPVVEPPILDVADPIIEESVLSNEPAIEPTTEPPALENNSENSEPLQ